MLNIDFGGAKRKNTVNGLWKVMDIQENSEYVYDMYSGKKFDLDDNTIDNYYSSNTLHMTKQSMINFLFSEFYRTLKPEGKIRIMVPDVEKSIMWYVNNSSECFKFKYAKPPCYPETRLGYLLAQFHTEDTYLGGKLKSVGVQHAFDFETLEYYLKEVNFSNVVKMSFGECSPQFETKDYLRYKDRGLFVEAEKL